MGTISNDQTMAQAQMLNPGLMGGSGQQPGMGAAFPWLKGGADPISEALANARANAYQPPQLDNSQYQNAQAQIPIGMAIAQALASFSKDPSVADTVRKQGMQDMGMVNTLAQQDMQRQRAQAALNMQSQQLNMARENQAMNIAKTKLDRAEQETGNIMAQKLMTAWREGGNEAMLAVMQTPEYQAQAAKSGARGTMYMFQAIKMANQKEYQDKMISLKAAGLSRLQTQVEMQKKEHEIRMKTATIKLNQIQQDAAPEVRALVGSIMADLSNGNYASVPDSLKKLSGMVSPGRFDSVYKTVRGVFTSVSKPLMTQYTTLSRMETQTETALTKLQQTGLLSLNGVDMNLGNQPIEKKRQIDRLRDSIRLYRKQREDIGRSLQKMGIPLSGAPTPAGKSLMTPTRIPYTVEE